MSQETDKTPPEPAAGSVPPVPPGPTPLPAPELLSIDEFARLDLRVARILEATRHPNADKLLMLRIDLGSEQRQLVAGIASCYSPEDLVGRLIIVVANLKPARLRGELSEGMLLAASSGAVISLLAPDQDLPPGSKVR